MTGSTCPVRGPVLYFRQNISEPLRDFPSAKRSDTFLGRLSTALPVDNTCFVALNVCWLEFVLGNSRSFLHRAAASESSEEPLANETLRYFLPVIAKNASTSAAKCSVRIFATQGPWKNLIVAPSFRGNTRPHSCSILNSHCRKSIRKYDSLIVENHGEQAISGENSASSKTDGIVDISC